ncbi:MAG: BON domain-containing protein [Caulobacteraceae bacterium]
MSDQPSTTPGGEERSLLDRAKDEVSSWFGDADAAARRQRDEAVGDHSGKGPENHLEPDARIVDDITRRLTDDASLDASGVNIESHDGVVTLKGQVTTSAQRAHAEEVSAAVAGVQRVDNRLVVA